jgi:4-alpha-glucanotransferase
VQDSFGSRFRTRCGDDDVVSIQKAFMDRSAGILLHPTSLPGPYGIGDLGPAAYAWVDTLVRARQSWWQLLPLGPTGAGDSPYQSFSAFAGNTLLLSPEAMSADGLLASEDLRAAHLPGGPVDYGAVIRRKAAVLAVAWRKFQAGAGHSELRSEFDQFRAREASWLDELALFLALKEEQGGRSWVQWPTELRLRQPAALRLARQRHRDAVEREQFGQFLFSRQWQGLKEYAHGQGVRLIGDLPIFVACDSVDVWVNPELFLLDSQRQPRVVAGVPPDYFSPTGQLWGNPHYNWEALKATDYSWWVARLGATLAQVDLVRLDHFRGFVAAWEVPADSPTAEIGRWVPGPGAGLLEKFRPLTPAPLPAGERGGGEGTLPLIAEDLGVITPEVEALRQRFGLPGMRILQFAWGKMAEERFLPHNYVSNTVVYTGTHDNDTTLGWYGTLSPAAARDVRQYVPALEANIALDLIRMAWGSVADLAVIPLQDLLGLGTEGRMNFPGRPEGNWRWRLAEGQLSEQRVECLAEWTEVYRRTPTISRRDATA